MKMGEFDIIHHIKQNLVSTHIGLIQGIGDDCAVIRKDADHVYLVTTDALVENVHFDLSYFSFIDLGKKSLAVNLSDIAAMGGKPQFAFVSVAVPPKVTEADIFDFYTGIDQIAQEFDVVIAGGDTSRSPNYFFVSITVIGEAREGTYKLRSAAKPGDGLYVSGKLGSAAIGFAALSKRRRIDNDYMLAFKNPRPRVVLGEMLAEISDVHAMIDLSDGLLQDLSHILKASNVEAKLELAQIPREDSFEAVCKNLRIDPVETLLAGGEDYQLLFTMPDKALPELKKKMAIKTNLKVTRVGEILPYDSIERPPESVHFQNIFIQGMSGERLHLKTGGFDHFR